MKDVAKWSRAVGKPYIRRANGKEQANTLRQSLELAVARVRWGRKGFYVMLQRKVKHSLMAVGRTKEELKASIIALRRKRFTKWSNEMKQLTQLVDTKCKSLGPKKEPCCIRGPHRCHRGASGVEWERVRRNPKRKGEVHAETM